MCGLRVVGYIHDNVYKMYKCADLFHASCVGGFETPTACTARILIKALAHLIIYCGH